MTPTEDATTAGLSDNRTLPHLFIVLFLAQGRNILELFLDSVNPAALQKTAPQHRH